MLKIERIFSNSNSLTLTDIMDSLITEYIENNFVEYSNSNKANLTTTYEISLKGDVA
ncbi:hypothetical protein HBE96_16490 [Clostridium sp. P21]|uniref:Uncharacterized protein n=1 Tax=Clostridium muellerianum TaxID=2716538 RepID=A0A7Y0EKR1_9CLOT|nr:hypothetical protein [Clostridium muellerianum]NMM64225.1 hypothetical protein [Clostridium muellerianum]